MLWLTQLRLLKACLWPFLTVNLTLFANWLLKLVAAIVVAYGTVQLLYFVSLLSTVQERVANADSKLISLTKTKIQSPKLLALSQTFVLLYKVNDIHMRRL